MKKIYILSIIILSNLLMGQVGINTQNPLTMLDVDGNVKIRNVEEALTSSTVPLVIDNNIVKKNLVKTKGLVRLDLANDFTTPASGVIEKVFNWRVVDSPSNDFNEATSVFTAPVAGLYKFTLTINVANVSGTNHYATGFVDVASNTWLSRFSQERSRTPISAVNGSTFTYSGVMQLTSNQRIYLGTAGNIRFLAKQNNSPATFIEIELVSTNS